MVLPKEHRIAAQLKPGPQERRAAVAGAAGVPRRVADEDVEVERRLVDVVVALGDHIIVLRSATQAELRV